MDNKIQVIDLRSDFDKLFGIVEEQQHLIRGLLANVDIKDRAANGALIAAHRRITTSIGKLKFGQ